jgi:maltose alpha-D-glucosyltransferase / alpha-amylase
MQRSDKESLLNWMSMLMRARRECGEIGSGAWRAVDTGNDAVLGLRYDVDDSATVIFNNLSSQRHTIAVDLLEQECATATDLFGDRTYGPIDGTKPSMRMDGYGYRWMRIGGVY